MKYKRGLVKDIEEQRLFEKEQKELKKKLPCGNTEVL